MATVCSKTQGRVTPSHWSSLRFDISTYYWSYFSDPLHFLACALGQSAKFFDTIRRKNLLIIDDFGLGPLDAQQRMDLMEIIEDRHGRAATIIASQLPVSAWFDVIGENTIADAILDRHVHTSHRIELKGELMRKKR